MPATLWNEALACISSGHCDPAVVAAIVSTVAHACRSIVAKLSLHWHAYTHICVCFRVDCFPLCAFVRVHFCHVEPLLISTACCSQVNPNIPCSRLPDWWHVVIIVIDHYAAYTTHNVTKCRFCIGGSCSKQQKCTAAYHIRQYCAVSRM
jgi:hypothetical protein